MRATDVRAIGRVFDVQDVRMNFRISFNDPLTMNYQAVYTVYFSLTLQFCLEYF